MNTFKSRKKALSSNPESGFTIIELLIATIIFSMVLMVILASFLQIGRMFYKGVSLNSTNESARTVLDTLSDDVKLSQGGYVSGGAGSNHFCVGLHRYTYGINKKLTSNDVNNPNVSSPVGVIVSTIPAGSCSSEGTNPRQLLGPDMQLNDLTMTCNSDVNCSAHIHIIFYGFDDSVFISRNNPSDTPDQARNRPDSECSGSLLSTQFCATSDLGTTIALGY